MSPGNSPVTCYRFYAEGAQIPQQWAAYTQPVTHLEASSRAENPEPRTASGSHMLLGCVTCVV